jgi:pyrimidine deaminase RibD-like protein
MCAKAIHHSGIVKVYAPLDSSYDGEGLSYLRENGIETSSLEGATRE